MDFEKYTVKCPPLKKGFSKEEFRKQAEIYRAEEKRLKEVFHDDLKKEAGTEGHPKESDLWHLAWEYGHAHGYSEIAIYYNELAILLSRD